MDGKKEAVMNSKSVLYTIPRRALILIAAGIMLLTGVPPARAEDDTATGDAETVYHADMVTSMNPDGIMLIVGGFRRWSGPLDREYGIPSSSNQLGFTLGVSPAYAKASAYDEWQPAIFAQLRLQYDLYRFFGENGALLSFPSADSKYGKHEVDALSGKEETGWGQRVMFQPVITAKAGPVIIRNTTDLAYYRSGGRGPYFLEWEYDTLLKDGDFLLNNRTAFLMAAWKGSRFETLLAGPFYEITHGSRADITRQRSGVQVFWSHAESIGSFSHPRVYAQIGINLQDRNRDKEAFLTAGLGFDF
jgi:hypothetical protein